MSSLIFALSPLLALSLGGLLLMLAEAAGRPSVAGPDDEASFELSLKQVSELALAAFVVLAAGAVLCVAVGMVDPATLPGVELVAPYLLIDKFSIFFSLVLCVGAALCALLAGGYLPEHRLDRGEFFPLLIFATVGGISLVMAGDLLTVFIGLETLSLGAYCLIGLRRGSLRAAEGALKYFLLGSFAAAIMMFGAALLYGATGHTDLQGIGEAVGKISTANTEVSAPLVLLGMVMIIVGLAFKVSAVPFHMWTPDAYEGAPTPTTTFMAVAVKTAAFAVMLRILLSAFGDSRLLSWGSGWPPALAALAVLSMTVGNLVAGRQQSVKRMLAYSSIAHAGYALVGVVATMGSSHAGQAGVMFYLLAYTVSTAGAFGSLIFCGSRGKEAVSYDDLAGLGRRHPGAALAFSVFLLSLAGVPPSAGFFGKLYVFTAAMDSGLYTLTVIGLLNSVLGAYYYLRVMVYMYMREPEPDAPTATVMGSGLVVLALVLAAVLVVGLGILPGSVLDAATASHL